MGVRNVVRHWAYCIPYYQMYLRCFILLYRACRFLDLSISLERLLFISRVVFVLLAPGEDFKFDFSGAGQVGNLMRSYVLSLATDELS